MVQVQVPDLLVGLLAHPVGVAGEGPAGDRPHLVIRSQAVIR